MIWIYSYHEGEIVLLREATPLLNFPYPRGLGSLRGANAPLKTNLPLPLDKGKGIKGIGLPGIKRGGERIIFEGASPLQSTLDKCYDVRQIIFG